MRKRILSFALALLLVLALPLIVGCTAKPPQDPGDGPNDEPNAADPTPAAPAGWPAADLPPGLPVYPGGVIDSTEKMDISFFMVIAETDKATYEAYIKTLEAAGWLLDGEETWIKDNWMLTVSFDEEYGVFFLLASESEFNFIHSSTEWPQDLPFELPVYPDGEITLAVVDGDDIMIAIEGSSQAGFEGYLDLVAKAGWEFEETDDPLTQCAGKDGWTLLLDLAEGTEVSITIFKLG